MPRAASPKLVREPVRYSLYAVFDVQRILTDFERKLRTSIKSGKDGEVVIVTRHALGKLLRQSDRG